MTPRSPTPSKRTGLYVLTAALGAGLVAGIVWKRGNVTLESRDASSADAKRSGPAEHPAPAGELGKARRATLPTAGKALEPAPAVAPWLRRPAFEGKSTNTFAVVLPSRVTYAADCDGVLPPETRVTDFRGYLRDRGVDAGALLPEGGRLFSWTRYFLSPEGGEASVAVRRVGPDKWVVRARVKAAPESKPGQSATRSVPIEGYDESPVGEARAREIAAKAHAQMARASKAPLGRTALIGLPSVAGDERGSEGATPEGPRDLIELRNGEILRATLHSETASCDARGTELACECASPFDE